MGPAQFEPVRRAGIDGGPELFGALAAGARDGDLAEQPPGLVGGLIAREVANLLLECGDVCCGLEAPGRPRASARPRGSCPQHTGLGPKGLGTRLIGKLREDGVGVGELAGLEQEAAGLQSVGRGRGRLPQCECTVGGQHHLRACFCGIANGTKSGGERFQNSGGWPGSGVTGLFARSRSAEHSSGEESLHSSLKARKRSNSTAIRSDPDGIPES